MASESKALKSLLAGVRRILGTSPKGIPAEVIPPRFDAVIARLAQLPTEKWKATVLAPQNRIWPTDGAQASISLQYTDDSCDITIRKLHEYESDMSVPWRYWRDSVRHGAGRLVRRVLEKNPRLRVRRRKYLWWRVSILLKDGSKDVREFDREVREGSREFWAISNLVKTMSKDVIDQIKVGEEGRSAEEKMQREAAAAEAAATSRRIDKLRRSFWQS